MSERSAPRCPRLSIRVRSAPSSDSSHAFSSGVSQSAFAGRSVICRSTTNASTTAGTASTMNSHCQPRRPHVPSMPSTAPDSTAATALLVGTAMYSTDSTRARYADGNQYVR